LPPSAETVRISPSRWSFQLTKALERPSRDQLGKSWKSPSGAVSGRGAALPAMSRT
jgi:hypothetical protein